MNRVAVLVGLPVSAVLLCRDWRLDSPNIGVPYL
jgi:hypothetical protein